MPKKGKGTWHYGYNNPLCGAKSTKWLTDDVFRSNCPKCRKILSIYGLDREALEKAS